MPPALVTPDEAGPADAIEFALTPNGTTMQSSSTADLIHSVGDVVAWLSMLMTLEVGDLIFLGTPAGVGRVREPPVFLVARRRRRRLVADAGDVGDDPALRWVVCPASVCGGARRKLHHRGRE